MRTPEILMDLEAELGAVQILLTYRNAIADEAFFRLPEEAFTDTRLQEFWALARETWNRYKDLSWSRLYQVAREIGSKVTPDELDLGPMVTLQDWPAICDRVEAAMIRRRLWELGKSLQDMALVANQDVRELQAQAQKLTLEVTSDKGQTDELVHVGQAISRVAQRVKDRMEGKGESGLNVGIAMLDQRTGGFKPGELVVLAGRPGMGKTAMALAWAAWVARRGTPVLFFSLEMPAEQIAARLIAREGPVELRQIRGKMALDGWAVFEVAGKKLSNWPIWIWDRRGVTAEQIAAVARAFATQHPDLGLIIVDHLQLVRPPVDKRKLDLRLQLADTTLTLRELAGQVKCPLVLLHQLNRGVENRENKRPTLADLRESGQVEEHADYVLLLYRLGYYEPQLAQKLGLENVAEVIVAKARDGETGITLAQFDPQYVRFQPLDEQTALRYLSTVLGDSAA